MYYIALCKLNARNSNVARQTGEWRGEARMTGCKSKKSTAAADGGADLDVSIVWASMSVCVVSVSPRLPACA